MPQSRSRSVGGVGQQELGGVDGEHKRQLECIRNPVPDEGSATLKRILPLHLPVMPEIAYLQNKPH